MFFESLWWKNIPEVDASHRHQPNPVILFIFAIQKYFNKKHYFSTQNHLRFMHLLFPRPPQGTVPTVNVPLVNNNCNCFPMVLWRFEAGIQEEMSFCGLQISSSSVLWGEERVSHGENKRQGMTENMKFSDTYPRKHQWFIKRTRLKAADVLCVEYGCISHEWRWQWSWHFR